MSANLLDDDGPIIEENAGVHWLIVRCESFTKEKYGSSESGRAAVIKDQAVSVSAEGNEDDAVSRP